jgi:hypothetical protein
VCGGGGCQNYSLNIPLCTLGLHKGGQPSDVSRGSFCETLDSHGGDYEDASRLGCGAV